MVAVHRPGGEIVCRALLADTAGGYALADLYNLDGIKTYTVANGVEYTIRDYTISISRREELGGLSLDVTGLLFCNG